MKRIRFAVRMCIQGDLGPDFFAIFDGLRVEPGASRTTVITGELRDQSALHGLLAAIRDLGLSLVSVESAATPGWPPRSESNVEGE